MTYKEIEDIKRIQKFDSKLRVALTRKGPFYEQRIIGYPGGYTKRYVNFIGKGPDAIWYCRWVTDDQNVVNLFGRGECGESQTLLIDLQFNYTLDKVKKSLGGAFLEDTDTGKITLGHRGFITVINRIPKDVVFDAMAAYSVDAQSGHKTIGFLLVADLNSKTLIKDIGEFAAELRDSVREKTEGDIAAQGSKGGDKKKKGVKPGFDPLKEYFDEFAGKRRSYKPKRVYAKVDHGKVVRALNKAFPGKNERTYKSRAVDLAVEQRKLALLFEVKTSANLQSIYTAIGQLSVHASPTKKILGKPVIQVVVVPEHPMEHITKVIADELGFRIVTYLIDKQGDVSFQGLDKL
jgi:hypothetical protein